MKVIAAKNITESARTWLCTYGAAIEHMHGLVIVFLPQNLRFSQSGTRDVSHSIALNDDFGRPTVHVEPGSDDERAIYMADDKEEDINP